MRRAKSVVMIVLSVAVLVGSATVYETMSSAPTRTDCRNSLEAEYNTMDSSSTKAPSTCFTEKGLPVIKPLEGASPGDTLVKTAEGFRVNSTGRKINLG